MHYVEQLSKNLSKENILYNDNLLFLTGILRNSHIVQTMDTKYRIKNIKKYHQNLYLPSDTIRVHPKTKLTR